MTLTRLLAAGATALALTTTSLFAGDIMVQDAYARSSTPSSVTGAAFFVLMNHGDTDDRLIAATSDIAKRAELHTHNEDANGVMRMMEIDGGIAVPAGEMRALKRGGDHVMLMGLTRPLVQGEEIAVTLTFEKAGDIEITIPVDRERKANHGAADHSQMNHSNDS